MTPKELTKAKIDLYGELVRDPNKSAAVLGVAWLLLFKYLNSESVVAWPAAQTLADDLGGSLRAVRYALEWLVDEGWFSAQRSKGRSTSKYTPNFSTVQPTAPLTVQPLAPLTVQEVAPLAPATAPENQKAAQQGKEGNGANGKIEAARRGSRVRLSETNIEDRLAERASTIRYGHLEGIREEADAEIARREAMARDNGAYNAQ